jgi:hypothetical protein
VKNWKPITWWPREIVEKVSLFKPSQHFIVSPAVDDGIYYVAEPFSYSDTSGVVDYRLGGFIDDTVWNDKRRALWRQRLDKHYWNGSVGEHELVPAEQMPACISRLVLEIWANGADFIHPEDKVEWTNAGVLENWKMYPPKSIVSDRRLMSVKSILYRP